MKTLKFILRFSLVLMLLFTMHSCLDYHVTTTVNPDGSILRVIQVFRSDSGAFDTGSMYIPTGEDWEITKDWVRIQETENDTIDKYVLTAKKLFTNYQELNEELLTGAEAIGLIGIETNLVKKFRWFYTEFRYSEIYKKHFPFDYFSVQDFLSEEEFMISVNPDDYVYSVNKDFLVRKDKLDEIPVLGTEDSLRLAEIEKDLEKKFYKWMGKNAWEEFIVILSEGMVHLDEGIQNNFALKKESIYVESGFEDKISPSGADFSADNLLTSIAKILETEEKILYQSNPGKFDQFFSKLEKMYDPANDSFKNTIIMPGRLYSANAVFIEGTECTWNIQFSEFFARDFEMYAVSRVINHWTYIVILMFSLTALLVTLLGKKRRF